MLMKTGILYFTTCFHSFGILRHVDPFCKDATHITLDQVCINSRSYGTLQIERKIFGLMTFIKLVFKGYNNQSSHLLINFYLFIFLRNIFY